MKFSLTLSLKIIYQFKKKKESLTRYNGQKFSSKELKDFRAEDKSKFELRYDKGHLQTL